MTGVPPTGQDPLPGLEPPAAAAAPLERAVRRTLAQLAARGHLDVDLDAGMIQLAVDLSQEITRKRVTGRASTLSNDARLLSEILAGFRGEATEVDDDLATAMREWGEVMHRAHAGPEVRDPT